MIFSLDDPTADPLQGETWFSRYAAIQARQGTPPAKDSPPVKGPSAYDSDTGSDISSDGSVVMSTMPKMRGITTIDADVGLYTSVGFRKFMAPEIDTDVEHTLFLKDDSEIQPDFGDFFNRHSVDPEETMNRVLFRWSDFVKKTLAHDNVDKYNAVVLAITWRRCARAIVKLDRQKAVPKNNKPGLWKKSMQVVATGAGLGLGAAATTVQTGLGAAATTVQTGWSFGQAVVGAVVNLGKKPDQTSPTRKHIRFDDSGGEDVVEEVVVRSENQMQVDLQARSDREEPSPAPPAATGTGASTAPVPPPLPGASTAPVPPPLPGASMAPTPPPPPAQPKGTGASKAPVPPAPLKPATRLGAAQGTRSAAKATPRAEPADQMEMMQNEMKKRLAQRKKRNDDIAEETAAETAAKILADQEAAKYLAENRLYPQDWLDGMPYKDPNNGPCVQKLYMAHKNAKPEPHVTASGSRGKDELITSLLLLTTEHRLEKLPWE